MTRSHPSLYDEDFFLWTQQQAAALRRASALGAEIDIAHVAEEIEDLGKRDLREVTSYIELLFRPMMKIEVFATSTSVPHWRSEARTFRRSALKVFTPGMRQLIDVAALWQEARETLEDDWRDQDIAGHVATMCPVSLAELLAPDFDLDAALAKLATASLESASPSGAPA